MFPHDVPDYCEALTGYRMWQVGQTGLLLGCSHAAPWPPRQPMQAQCHSAQSDYAFTHEEPHLHQGTYVGAPAQHCSCGCYAYRDRGIYEENSYATWSGGVRVWGSVRLWGRVIQHEWGFRAEYAYPHELITNDAAMSARLATLYGVRVTCQPDEPTPEDDTAYTLNAGMAQHGYTLSLGGVRGTSVNLGALVSGAWQQAVQTMTIHPSSFWNTAPPPPSLIIHPDDVYEDDEPATLIWEPDDDDLRLVSRSMKDLHDVALFLKIARGERCE